MNVEFYAIMCVMMYYATKNPYLSVSLNSIYEDKFVINNKNILYIRYSMENFIKNLYNYYGSSTDISIEIL